jgi:BolA family transcriptional regulator, general stress-responsive regulator
MSRKSRISTVLHNGLSPTHVEIIDNSAAHAEHLPVLQGHVNPDESHLTIVVVSEIFNDLSLVNRHRKVNALVAPEFDTGLHALTIQPFTPEEWKLKHVS